MSKSLIVEIRAAEGGEDAKDLVNLQFSIYRKYASRFNLEIELIDVRLGFICFRVLGKGALKRFKNESGGLRWQRIPPTEKKGRVHTSTITVAVLREVEPSEVDINEKDLDWKACRGSGAGGQHRNVTDSAVQLTHKPTGIQIRCEAGRSQSQNKEQALQILGAKLKQAEEERAIKKVNSSRRSQVGSGMRGDKTRTIRLQDDTVTDHTTNKKMSAKKYMKGQIECLY